MSSFSLRVAGAVALAIALPFAVTACGGGGGGDENSIVIGTKFDQPGLGLKNPDGKMSGFDVDVATYVAKELGYPADKIEWKESPSGQRETLIQNDQVKFIAATYSITDARKEKVELRGAVPGHRAEPAGEGGQHGHHRRRVAAEQQEALLGVGFDACAADQGQVPGCAASAVRHLFGVRRGAEERGRRRGHHRRGHPRRLCGADARACSRSSASRSRRRTTASA